MHSIAITDPLPFDEADLAKLRALGTLTISSSLPTSEQELINRLSGHDVAVVGWCNLPRKVLEAANHLRFVSLWAAGSDHVDLVAARERGIQVSTAADYATIAVAEFTVAAIITLLRRVPEAARSLQRGVKDWRPFQGHDLNSRTVGVVGSGAIGASVIRLLHAFGANVLCHTRRPSAERAKALGVTFVEMDELVGNADVITLHIPLTPETRHLFDERRLRMMKKNAILVNTARGPLVDEAVLVKLLREGHLGGAALDVFSKEPPEPPGAWFEQDNLLLTPHIAFNTAEALIRKTATCIANVEAFARGRPEHVVT
jgi:D-3-phosphoglycerate dehydrogenase